MPKTSSKAPNKKRTRVPGGSGAIVMLKSNTIAVIGSTDATDSYTFSIKSLFCRIQLLLSVSILLQNREKSDGKIIKIEERDRTREEER